MQPRCPTHTSNHSDSHNPNVGDVRKRRTMNPHYEHDCDTCRFVGQHTDQTDGTLYDLYICPTEPNVVARYSNNGPDYTSGLEFIGHSAPLTAAWEAALTLAFDILRMREMITAQN